MFDESKKLLASSQALVHFNLDLEIRLARDASDYGISAVLSQIMTDGSEKPVGFVSRTLTDSEKYSQLEKEAWLVCMASSVFIPTYSGIKLFYKLIINN